MNDEAKRVWKEAVVAYFPPENGKTKKTSVKTSGLRGQRFEPVTSRI
jgi:hypothetical protein